MSSAQDTLMTETPSDHAEQLRDAAAILNGKQAAFMIDLDSLLRGLESQDVKSVAIESIRALGLARMQTSARMDAHDRHDAWRTTLELIALDQSCSPAADAAKVLMDTGFWTDSDRELLRITATSTVVTDPEEQAGQHWRCFHCSEVFADSVAARVHFGDRQSLSPACTIDIKHVRWLEEQHRRSCDEDTDALRSLASLAGEHERLRASAEELGYARGLSDAKKHPGELGLMVAPSAESTSAPVAPFHAVTHHFSESNGNKWWTVMLHRQGDGGSSWHGFEHYTDKIEGRADYECARLNAFLTGVEPPCVLDFKTDPTTADVAQAGEH